MLYLLPSLGWYQLAVGIRNFLRLFYSDGRVSLTYQGNAFVLSLVCVDTDVGLENDVDASLSCCIVCWKEAPLVFAGFLPSVYCGGDTLLSYQGLVLVSSFADLRFKKGDIYVQYVFGARFLCICIEIYA